MADSDGLVDPSAPSVTPTSPSPDQISLTILSPSPEVTNIGRLVLELPIDTSISRLKQQIQDVLPTKPTPERQRLIYRGHALLNGHTTLRQILRANPAEAISTTYTLHLVLPPSPQTAVPGAREPLVHAPQPHVAGYGATTVPLPQAAQSLPQNHHNAFIHAQQTQQALQQQLNILQQQMGTLQPHPGPIPNLPPQGAMHMTYHIQGGQAPMPFTPGVIPGPQNVALMQRQVHQQMQQHMQQHMHQLAQQQQQQQSQQPLHGQGEMVPQPVSQTVDGPPSGATANIRSPGASVPSADSGNVRHLPYPFVAQQRLPAASTPTTAWVLSSPNGPEALLFAPGHGYFASPGRATTARLVPTRVTRQRRSGRNSPSNRARADQPSTTVAAPAPEPAPAGGQVALRPREPAPDPNQNPVIDRANNDEDVMNFVIRRGWLFLRLYMFILVFSEVNSWRRWLLLSVAGLVCLLPRRNPLNTALIAARRHVDDLIGPAAPTRRQGQPIVPPAQGQPGNAATGVGATQHARLAQPTPEDTATRLVRQHQQQNPNMVRGMLFRIERALALFLASLVPGVGERHVRAREEAREEARRDAERIENEQHQQSVEQLSQHESIEAATIDSGASTAAVSASNDDQSKAHPTATVGSGEVDADRTATASSAGVQDSG